MSNRITVIITRMILQRKKRKSKLSLKHLRCILYQPKNEFCLLLQSQKSSASDKAKLFTEIFSKSSNLDDSGISLPAFPSRTNLKLHTFL